MRLSAALILGAALALPAGRGAAQQECSAALSQRTWSAPLDRRIPLRARDVSLREALDRIAAAARFRLSYSADFLPLDRHVCLAADSVAAGDALAELLRGVNVSPMVTGPDQVVIAPIRQPIAAPADSARTLAPVVVTSSAAGRARRPLTVAVDVVERDEVERQSSGTLASTFDGSVPGLWVWEQSPSSLLARYGSVRGASSFGLSYPKVYIDGIEVANPLLMTDVNPASLDRIEVIRGPQGAALYGADAISGVVNIVTRHDGVPAGASRTEVLSRVGPSQSAFTDRAALAQNHSLTWRAGSNLRSGSVGVNVATIGGYVPEAYSRDVKLNGGFRVITQGASVIGTARLSNKSAAVGQNPLIQRLLSISSGYSNASANRANLAEAVDDGSQPLAEIDSVPQTVTQYTVGVTSTLLSGTRWVPTFSAGIDGYRLANVPNESTLIPSELDKALRSAEGSAHRVTFRTSLVGQYDVMREGSLTLTLSGEHSTLDEVLAARGRDAAGNTVSRFDSVSSRTNAGFVAQANLALHDALFVTAGGRVEQSEAFTLGTSTLLLPMLGVAAVHDIGGVSVKGRAAYGVGARPVRSSARLASSADPRTFAPGRTLDPEKQSGIEAGLDVFASRRFALHVTRFDQTATGLIQPVPVYDEDWANSASGKRAPGYELQNVGEITNRGWEIESSLDVRGVSFAGAFTTVDSRVRRTAPDYGGDLRPGDRMLGVPAGTASLSAAWQVLGWRAGMTASRAFDWVNYDRLRIARDFAGCDTSCDYPEMFAGSRPRTYWMHYDGVTRLRASLSRDLPRGLGLRLTVDNLTNVQSGEPDNITVLPGRTLLFGMSAKIR